jgi:hypothetical protein
MHVATKNSDHTVLAPTDGGTLDRPASLVARGVSLRHRYRCEDGMVVMISLLVGDHAPHSSTRRFWFQALALGSTSTGGSILMAANGRSG